MAKGARSIKSHLITSAQLMCYSELTFYEREGRRWLREASPIEVFYPIRLDIEGFALAQYFFSICCELFPEGNADGAADMLRLPGRQSRAASRARSGPFWTCCAGKGSSEDGKRHFDRG